MFDDKSLVIFSKPAQQKPLHASYLMYDCPINGVFRGSSTAGGAVHL
jgi:hypothetical protein